MGFFPLRVQPGLENPISKPLDVIIPAFNNPDLTTRAVISVLYSEPKARVILVDNGSTVDDLSFLKPLLEARGHVFIRLDVNAGPYAAVNAAMPFVTAPVFAVVCNDCAVLPGALGRLAAALTPEIPYLCAREVQHTFFDPALLTALAEISHPLKVPSLRCTSGVFFTCFVVRKDFYDLVGPLDDRFKLTFGDTDWEQRANDALTAAGGQLLQTSSVVVFHGGSVTRKRMGVEADLALDVKDHDAFLDKWKDRPDVLAKHPKEKIEDKREFLKNEWPTFGEA